MKTKTKTKGTNMKTKTCAALIAALTAAVLLAACPVDSAEDAGFTSAPVLALAPGDGTLTVAITDSVPPADRYDLYWIEGAVADPAAIKAASGEISGAVSGVAIPNLTNGQTYSVLAVAIKAGYTGVESAIKNAAPAAGTFTALPAVSLNAGNAVLSYTVSASTPAADRYELYWAEGGDLDAAAVKAGTKISSITPGTPGTITGLTNGASYSVLAVAFKAGYTAADSTIQSAAPNGSLLLPFTAAPAVTLIVNDGALDYAISPSIPVADSYELYWAAGSGLDAAAVKNGVHIPNTPGGGRISGLDNDTGYSVLAVANKAGYTSIDSAVQSAAPQAGAELQNFTNTPYICVGFSDQRLFLEKNAGVGIHHSEAENATFDIYWKAGQNLTAQELKAFGAKITNVDKTVRTIIASGLPKGAYYSLMAVVNKPAYNSKDTDVVSGMTVPDVYNVSTPTEYKTLVSINGGTVTGSGAAAVGMFKEGRNITLSSFKIAKYETTFQLWKEVYDWAITHGYTFINTGTEGHSGRPDSNYGYAGAPPIITVPGSGTGAAAALNRELRPVTFICWGDAVVWCNAYSEKESKTPVYTYIDEEYPRILRDANIAELFITSPDLDMAGITPGANGYRLPTDAEWEYAARGGNPADTENWNYTYAGSNTVGDVAWYQANAGSGVSGDSLDFGIHPVGTRAANSAGLFDMSGNAAEWCFDQYKNNASLPNGDFTDPIVTDGSWPVRRNGNHTQADTYQKVSYRNFGGSPYPTVGFRVASNAD